MSGRRITAKQNRLAVKLVLIAVLMFGFGYAMIPVYEVLCSITGINGKTEAVAAPEIAYRVDKSREVSVEFIVSVNRTDALAFRAETGKIKVHPGEYHTVNFLGKNNTDQDLVMRTMPSISPGMAAEYLKKTECFCFSEQTLKAGESRKFPVRFAISPELPARYTVMTLSLSIFDITEKTVTQNSK